jgi:hypothetical protein
VEEEDLHEELLQEEEAHPLQCPPPVEDDLQPGGVGSGVEAPAESSNLLETMTVKVPLRASPSLTWRRCCRRPTTAPRATCALTRWRWRQRTAARARRSS